MIFAVIVGVLFVGYGAAYVASDDVRFLTRAGFEETRILQSRQPIPTVVADPTIPAPTRDALTLVLSVRDYAAELGLKAKATYTTYAEVDRDTLLLVLSASRRECLCPYIWRYPIVGRVPYKGFFDFAMAHRAAARLDADGYDTYLRPSGAFSTLGWFNDPLLSTALTRDSVELAATVFHEIAHNTLYVPSATAFNESFAQMVGYLAAAEFFASRGEAVASARARDRWHDEVLLAGYYGDLRTRLDSVYGAGLDSAAVEAGRREVSGWARDRLGAMADSLRTYRVDPTDQPINNARILARGLYRTELDRFDAWYRRYGAEVRTSVAALRELERGAEGDSAMVRLRSALASP